AVVRAGAVPRAAGRADGRPGADRPGDRPPPPIRRWTPGAGSRPDDDRPVARGRTAGLRARGSVTEASEGVAARPAVRPLVAWSVLAVASVGVLLSGAELMVVAIALPSIVVDFGGWADLARVSWIINAYLLAFVVAMPLAGRTADLWGARRLYVIALLLFA